MHDIDKWLIHAFVLLGRQFLVLEYVARRRKSRVLSGFEQAIAKGAQDINDVLKVYELTFSLVDNIVRYEKIASMLPRFSKKSDEFKLFEARLSGMKELRNLLQHIQGDIDTEFESPILGGVTWARGKYNYMAAFNDLGAGRSLPGLVYDRKEDRFTKEFCYVHNGKYYDLALAIAGCQDYQRYVNEKCEVQVDGKDYVVNEHFVALKMGFLSAEEVAQQDARADALTRATQL